jgi:F0F1-type ATP synthase membrane subunit b/b'
MNPASLIPSLQSDALAREIEQQLKDETGALIAAAEREARNAIAQARTAARGRLHDAVVELRRQGGRRLARAKAQVETETRAEEQRQAGRAVADALPLLSDALSERWREPQSRRLWTDAVARLCGARLRRAAWTVAHPTDWPAQEQREFAASLGAGGGLEVAFAVDKNLTAGLKVSADQAVLDATPHGLLADLRTIAGLLLEEIGREDRQ